MAHKGFVFFYETFDRLEPKAPKIYFAESQKRIRERVEKLELSLQLFKTVRLSDN